MYTYKCDAKQCEYVGEAGNSCVYKTADQIYLIKGFSGALLYVPQAGRKKEGAQNEHLAPGAICECARLSRGRDLEEEEGEEEGTFDQ